MASFWNLGHRHCSFLSTLKNTVLLSEPQFRKRFLKFQFVSSKKFGMIAFIWGERGQGEEEGAIGEKRNVEKRSS